MTSQIDTPVWDEPTPPANNHQSDTLETATKKVDSRFSNPKKMGFMRFIMFVEVWNILTTVVSLVFLSKNTVTFSFSDYWLLLNMVFSAVGFWLLWKRKEAARAALIAFSILNICEAVTNSMLSGNIDPINTIVGSLWDFIVLIYMCTSRRARAVLVRPFQDSLTKSDQREEAGYYQPATWAFWRNLIIYFCVFSVVGHWMEAGYCLLIKYGILPGIYDPNSQIWSDWLYPFPVYGFGVVACVLILYPIKLFLQKHIKTPIVPLILSFIINGSVCCLIELIMGLMTNMDYQLWDYRDMFGNFMGQICLQNGVAFGAVATLMTWVLYPLLEFLIRLVPKSTMTVIFIVIVAFYAILWTFYLINMPLPDMDALMRSIGLTPLDEMQEGEFGITIETREWGQ